MRGSDEIREVQSLVSAFPALFGGGLHAIPEGTPLTGYFHTDDGPRPVPDTHGHYIEDRVGSVSVIHKHKGGRRAHFHEEAKGG